MKNKLLKYNHIIMVFILIIITITIFLVAQLISGINYNKDTSFPSEEKNKINTDDIEVISKLYSSSISQSDNPLDIEEEEEDYAILEIETIDEDEKELINQEILNNSDLNNNNNIVSNTDNELFEKIDLQLDEIENNVYNTSPDFLLLREGSDYYIDGYYDDALKTLRRLNRIYPESQYVSIAEIIIGKTLIGRGRVKNNRDDYIRANEILLTQLKSYIETKNYNEDILLIEELVEFVIELSKSNKELNIPNIEIEYYLEKLVSITTEENKKHIYASIGYLKLFRYEYDEAIRAFKMSKTDLSLIGLSKVYSILGKIDEALEIWIDFMENKKLSYYYPDAKPLFKKYAFNYAMDLYNKKDFINAIKYYNILDKYLSNTMEEEETKYYKSLSLFYIQRYDEAIVSFNDILLNKIYKRDSYAIFYKGKTRIEIGRLKTDIVQKMSLYEIALSNLIEFNNIYQQHPFKQEAQKLIDFLEEEIKILQ